jgi:hypothetical protein
MLHTHDPTFNFFKRNYRVFILGRFSVLHAQMRPICQVKLRTPKKRSFALFLLGRVGIFVSFDQTVCWELKSSFWLLKAYTGCSFWDKELTKRRKMVEMTGGLFQI